MPENYLFQKLDFQSKTPEQMLDASRTFYEAIKKRRTVRDYSDRHVDREIIENAIKSAGTAPSGANMQPWHFVAVNRAEVKAKIREAAEKEEQAFYDHRASEQWLDALAPLGTDDQKPFLETAPWLIIVFLKKFSEDTNGTRLKNYYTSESVGIATGFLINALHDSGLATLTHTPSPMKFLNNICGRPGDERPFLLLVTGYPAENAEVPCIEKMCLNDISTFI